MDTRIPYEYIYKGTLDDNSPTYTKRKADDELYDALKASEFCYVFNARKMGKSSLRTQTMRRLQSEGIACAAIDLSGSGTDYETPSQLYAGIIDKLVGIFNLDINLDFWWSKQELLSPASQFSKFIETVLLVELLQNNNSQKIVIFFDEIDTLLRLKFSSDDLFALIRACYNQRADNPIYKCLTFCLIGVATPSYLIADKQRTPFNIGKAIELTGFTLEEAKPSLMPGLQGKVNNPEIILQEVLNWTGGQPFLTQKVCSHLVHSSTEPQENEEAKWVEEIVKNQIITNWQSKDEPAHLNTILERIIWKGNEKYRNRLLGLYQRILLSTGASNEYSPVVVDESKEQVELRLSGLVVKSNVTLKVYNRIYELVFDWNWAEKELAKLRPYAAALKQWRDSDCQDESRLLRGQSLQDAKEWARNKSLSDLDYQFLNASQDLENQENQRASKLKVLEAEIQLGAEKRERELDKLEAEIQLGAERTKLAAQEKATQVLRGAKKKADRWLFRSLALLVAALAVFVIAGIWATQLLNEAQTATRIERQGVNAQRQFETQQISALLSAMSSGQELQKLIKDRPLEKYPATSPMLALQTILDDIQERTQIKGYQGEGVVFTNVNFSPTRKYIVTASNDYTARVWDFSGNELLKQPLRHQGIVNSANFSTDGQYIVTASDDGTARVWDLSGNELLKQRLTHPQGRVKSANFSPNGQRIVTASSDKTAKVWNLSGKQQLISLIRHTDKVNSASFSRDGQRIVTASDDRTVKVWDSFSGKLLNEFKPTGGYVYSASFSPNGKQIITATADNTVRIWDSSSGKLLVKLPGHEDWVLSASFSPNGKYVATASIDNTVKVWDLFGRQQPLELKGHRKSLQSASFSPDGQRIVTASDDRTAIVWDLAGKQQPLELKGHNFDVRSASFSPNGQRIVTASSDYTAIVWDSSSGKPLLPPLTGHNGWVFTANFSPNGQRIVTASSDYTAIVWDSSSGKPLLPPLKGHNFAVSSASFSPDGHRILTGSWDNTAKIWDLSGKQQPILPIKHRGWIFSASFSPNGQHILTASKDTTAKMWNLSGKHLLELRGHQEAVRTANFSPDGQRIITASDDRTARVWNLSGMQLAELRGHQEAVTSASFSHDGQRIVTASKDRTARVWQVENLDQLLARGCHWLKDYLDTHPADREKLKVCQK